MINIQDFIDNFADVFDETDISDLSAETKFRELEEWSSICALGLIAMVNDEYDVELTAAEFRSANTIQQLFDIVKDKI